MLAFLRITSIFVLRFIYFTGTLTLDLNSFQKGSKQDSEGKLYALDTTIIVNLFSMRSIRGWWPLKSIEPNTGTAKFGVIINIYLNNCRSLTITTPWTKLGL